MSFNPQGYPFTALPTNLRGKLQPNQLAVLWVIQSYASKDDQTCYPSLSSIAKFACISKRTAQYVVNQLVALGYLERFYQTGNNGEQSSNLYKVTVWHLANVPEPSIGRRSKSCTPAPNAMPPTQTLHPPIANAAPKLDSIKLDTNKLDKKNKKEYSEAFNEFWLKYTKMNFTKSVSQSKKLASAEWKKLTNEVKERLIYCLELDIKERNKLNRGGNWVPMFPDCFRWIKNGQYEQFLELALAKKDAIVRKPSEKDNPNDLPF